MGMRLVSHLGGFVGYSGEGVSVIDDRRVDPVRT